MCYNIFVCLLILISAGDAMILSTHCYIERDDQILMMHRIKKKNDIHMNRWVGLGGKMNPGETPEQCIIREIYEESNLKANSVKLRGFITFPDFMGDNDWYMFLFSCDDFSGDVIENEEGKLKWIPKSDINQLNMLEGDKIFMKWMTKYNFFTARFIYKDDELIDYSLDTII